MFCLSALIGSNVCLLLESALVHRKLYPMAKVSTFPKALDSLVLEVKPITVVEGVRFSPYVITLALEQNGNTPLNSFLCSRNN